MRKSVHTQEYASLLRRLVAMRGKAGLSQRALAAKLGVAHSWVAKVECGERRIDLIEFGSWCKACGVNAAKSANSFLRTVETGETDE